jgi:predicted O-methyltransferase YrrM
MEQFYNNIHGWFDYEELYCYAFNNSPDNAHFVEVGTWLGKSAAFMAVLISNSNKNIKFDCVDLWDLTKLNDNGSSLTDVIDPNISNIVKSNFYDEFLKNIDPVKNIINPIKLSSLDASKLYNDNSLDFVFIDATHVYDDVKNDINSWYPKVKSGVILAGHDYACLYVEKAVDEFIANNSYQLNFSSGNCWYINKV